VIANLMSRSFDLRNHLGVPQGSFADEEESCLGVMPMKYLQHFGRESWMWAVVEGKRNHRAMSPNSINNIGRQSLYHAQDRERFHPKHYEPCPQESGGHQEDGHRVSTSLHAGREPIGFSVIDFLCYIHLDMLSDGKVGLNPRWFTLLPISKCPIQRLRATGYPQREKTKDEKESDEPFHYAPKNAELGCRVPESDSLRREGPW